MAQFLRHRKKFLVMLVTNLTLPMLCYAFYQRLPANAKQISEETMGILSWIILGLLPVFWRSGSCQVKMVVDLYDYPTGDSRCRSRRMDQHAFGFGKVDGFNFGSFVVAVIVRLLCYLSTGRLKVNA